MVPRRRSAWSQRLPSLAEGARRLLSGVGIATTTRTTTAATIYFEYCQPQHSALDAYLPTVGNMLLGDFPQLCRKKPEGTRLESIEPVLVFTICRRIFAGADHSAEGHNLSSNKHPLVGEKCKKSLG